MRDARLAARAGAACLALLSIATPAPAQPAPNPPVSIGVYGTILTNAGHSTSQLAVPDIPLWALTGALTPAPIGGDTPPLVDAAGRSAFEMTARQTRLGARISTTGAASGWTAAGQLEVDFLGARPAAAQGAVFNQPRLRLALATLSHESGWRVVAGQDWVTFAPLNPTSFAHFAIPLAASGGNPWMRLPQFRVERTVTTGAATVLAQAALLSPVGGSDSPVAGTLADSPSLSGARSGQPFYQARLAVSRRPQEGGGTVGVSGHYGREQAESNTVPSWGVALDGTWAAAPRVALSGELWHGANLDTFQAGIAQGVARRGSRFHAVHATGGWLQISAALPRGWRASGGAAEDNPRDEDLTATVSRARNRVIWGTAMYALHPAVTLAVQHSYFSTRHRSGGPGAPVRAAHGHHVNAALAFVF